jgi:acetoacetyl-CoA synthetase
VVDESARMDSIPVWFDGVNINWAENLLYTRSSSEPSDKRTTKGKEDNKVAVTEVREGATEIRDVTWRQLRSGVAELASAMKNNGVQKGDRIAILASNSLDTLQVFLAATALGAVFSSSSTDMGTKGVLDRLLQIRPKVCESSWP